MKLLNSFLLAIAFVFLLINCTQSSSQTNGKQPLIFFDNGFGRFGRNDSLVIGARFSECGEWSGHEETVVVKINSNGSIMATYKIYPYNCDSLDYYYFNRNLNPTTIREITLDDRGKQSISDYMQRLVKSKITEQFPGHAGDTFWITNSDSSLLIRVYDSDDSNVSSFRQLITELDLD